MFDAISHLDRLLNDFTTSKESALNLASPNPEDDEYIRCGMIGFAKHLTLDRWSHLHFSYVQALRDEVMTEDFSQDWIRFVCLAAGYFKGMADAGLIDEVQLRLSEAQTPGFMWLKSPEF